MLLTHINSLKIIIIAHHIKEKNYKNVPRRVFDHAID